MQIRPYQVSDHANVMELLRLNTPEYFAAEEEADLLRYLEHHAQHYFVAEKEGMLVGCGGFNLSEDGHTGKISWDIVHPGCQGMGIGTGLTKYRMDKMMELPGIERISVRTSQLAYRFYERFGLEVREVVTDYWAPGFDLYRLDRDVASLRMQGFP